MLDSEDESTMWGNAPHGGPSRHDHHGQDLHYRNTHHTGKHFGPSNFITNAGNAGQRNPKSFCHDNGGYHDSNNTTRVKTQTS
jgi:hypothetical protein